MVSLVATAAFALGGALGTPAIAAAQPAKAADPSKPHPIAVYVEGAKAAEIREEILSILLHSNATAVDAGQFRDQLTQAGQKVPVGVPLTLSKVRKPVLSRFGKAASGVGAEAMIIGVVKPGRAGTRDVLVLWVKTDDTEPTVERTIPLNGSEKDAIASALEPQLSALKSGSGDAQTPVAPATAGGDAGKDSGAGKKDEAPAPGDQPARPRNTHGREIFSLVGAFDLGGRFFRYHQPLTTNLRDYSVFGAPGVAVAGEVYPMAGLNTPVIQGLGVVADFRIALGLGSKTKDGTKVDTSWNRFDVGLRYRQPLAKIQKKGDKAVVLGLKGTFGRDAFTLSTKDATLEAATPSVSYLFMRVGLDAEFPAGPIFLLLKGGYLGAFSAGDVNKRFETAEAKHPGVGKPSIGGIDIGGGVTVPIISGFEIRFTGEYDRWFYAFKARPADTYIAGGAVDQNIHLELGPAYVF